MNEKKGFKYNGLSELEVNTLLYIPSCLPNNNSTVPLAKKENKSKQQIFENIEFTDNQENFIFQNNTKKKKLNSDDNFNVPLGKNENEKYQNTLLNFLNVNLNIDLNSKTIFLSTSEINDNSNSSSELKIKYKEILNKKLLVGKDIKDYEDLHNNLKEEKEDFSSYLDLIYTLSKQKNHYGILIYVGFTQIILVFDKDDKYHNFIRIIHYLIFKEDIGGMEKNNFLLKKKNTQITDNKSSNIFQSKEILDFNINNIRSVNQNPNIIRNNMFVEVIDNKSKKNSPTRGTTLLIKYNEEVINKPKEIDSNTNNIIEHKVRNKEDFNVFKEMHFKENNIQTKANLISKKHETDKNDYMKHVKTKSSIKNDEFIKVNSDAENKVLFEIKFENENRFQKEENIKKKKKESNEKIIPGDNNFTMNIKLNEPKPQKIQIRQENILEQFDETIDLLESRFEDDYIYENMNDDDKGKENKSENTFANKNFVGNNVLHLKNQMNEENIVHIKQASVNINKQQTIFECLNPWEQAKNLLNEDYEQLHHKKKSNSPSKIYNKRSVSKKVIKQKRVYCKTRSTIKDKETEDRKKQFLIAEKHSCIIDGKEHKIKTKITANSENSSEWVYKIAVKEAKK